MSRLFVVLSLLLLSCIHNATAASMRLPSFSKESLQASLETLQTSFHDRTQIFRETFHASTEKLNDAFPFVADFFTADFDTAKACRASHETLADRLDCFKKSVCSNPQRFKRVAKHFLGAGVTGMPALAPAGMGGFEYFSQAKSMAVLYGKDPYDEDFLLTFGLKSTLNTFVDWGTRDSLNSAIEYFGKELFPGSYLFYNSEAIAFSVVEMYQAGQCENTVDALAVDVITRFGAKGK